LHNVVLQQWPWDKEIMFILMRLCHKMITTTLKMILYTTRISLVLICKKFKTAVLEQETNDISFMQVLNCNLDRFCSNHRCILTINSTKFS
jgi:hypothetical protein